jgi:predicted O-methyltransferase YrrM
MTSADALAIVEQSARAYQNQDPSRPRIHCIDPGPLHLPPMTPRTEPLRDIYANHGYPEHRLQPELEHDPQLVFLFQDRGEACDLLDQVLPLAPRRLAVEIGFERGASHLLWRALFETVVSIDIDPRKFLDFLMRFPVDARSVFVAGDSGDPRAAAVVAELGAVDFLLIDGNHRAEAFLLDYLRYAPLVRDGGIVAIHDAVSSIHVDVGQMIGRLQSGETDGYRHPITIYGTRVGIAIETMTPAARAAIQLLEQPETGCGAEGMVLVSSDQEARTNVVQFLGRYYLLPWSAGPVSVERLRGGEFHSATDLEGLDPARA